jgi:hypothetical protein
MSKQMPITLDKHDKTFNLLLITLSHWAADEVNLEIECDSHLCMSAFSNIIKYMVKTYDKEMVTFYHNIAYGILGMFANNSIDLEDDEFISTFPTIDDYNAGIGFFQRNNVLLAERVAPVFLYGIRLHLLAIEHLVGHEDLIPDGFLPDTEDSLTSFVENYVVTSMKFRYYYIIHSELQDGRKICFDWSSHEDEESSSLEDTEIK